MSASWGWKPERTVGIWRYGAGWLKPFVAAAPFLSVGLILLMLHMVGGTMTVAEGVLFDLPDGAGTEGENTEMVALVTPMRHDTMIFFDDSRYILGDPASIRAFGENLAASAGRNANKTLLVLADRRVTGGDLMGLAALAKRSGVEKILFAEKKREAGE